MPTWFCFSGDFLFWALLKHLLRIFVCFLSKCMPKRYHREGSSSPANRLTWVGLLATTPLQVLTLAQKVPLHGKLQSRPSLSNMRNDNCFFWRFAMRFCFACHFNEKDPYPQTAADGWSIFRPVHQTTTARRTSKTF